MQPIAPFLWFEGQADEAVALYVSAFEQGRIDFVMRYPDGPLEGPIQGMEGKVLTAGFELAGRRFMALDGGPYFKLKPSISFFVGCETEAQIDRLWATLVEGGAVLMEYGPYPFSPKYGWLQDKYGVSWQLSLSGQPQSISPYFLFVGPHYGQAEEAIRHYMSLFPASELLAIQHAEGEAGGGQGAVQFALFTLNGQPFMAMEDNNPGHEFAFNEAVSLCVDCATQEEIDALWERLSAVPEAEQCGWLKDKFGVSWQIVPEVLYRFHLDADPVAAKRVMDVLFTMKRLDIAQLEAAYRGEEPPTL